MVRRLGFRKSRFLIVIPAALVLLAAATLINLWFGRVARQIVTDQFNEEQLVVARGVKYWIEKQIGFLEKELILLAQSLNAVPMAFPEADPWLKPCFERVMESGVGRIELHDDTLRLRYTFYPYRPQAVTMAAAPVSPVSGENPPVRASEIRVTQVSGEGSGDLHLELTTGLDPAGSRRVSFQLNLSWFLSPLLKGIRSGKSGYAWLIDSQGRFLYHPQASFVGQSAFEARQGRDPAISYHLINTIQRDNMLMGLEGTGSYHSTWHRGITGKIEKLIAYTPVVIARHPRQTWSVAVVAPVFEIEAAMRAIYRWQAILQSLVLLVIVAAGGVVLGFEVRWSRRLEETVAVRTEALKRSEENYRSLVESAEDFIFVLDREGRLISVNSYTATCFGSRAEELIGQGVDQLFNSATAERQIKIVRTVFEKGKSVRDEFELAVGESDIWISANFMPLKNPSGQMNAVLCIARDITENKKLERRLINTEKLASLGTLAAGVAHEINNPLGVILGFCDLLVSKKQPGSQEYEDLKIIERQGLHCKQIVENLLSFARVGRETTVSTDLNQCLLEIIKFVRHSLEMRAIELQIHLSDNLPRVAGDDRQLQQVFLNLINNAAAAMPAGGPLEIATFAVDGGRRVAARIRDQGTGIAPEILDHIFEPFFTTKPEGEGTGLGLFVSYGIVSKFGGSISCASNTHESRDRSRETIFTVELPAAREEA